MTKSYMSPDDPNVVAIERDLERWFNAYLFYYLIKPTRPFEGNPTEFADNALHDLRTKRVAMFEEMGCK